MAALRNSLQHFIHISGLKPCLSGNCSSEAQIILALC